MKKCTKCGLEKELTEFYFRNDSGNYRNECIECWGTKTGIYYRCHLKEAEEYNQKRGQENRITLRLYDTNRNKIRRNNDPKYKLDQDILNQISHFINNSKYKSLGKFEIILGFSGIELKLYLESLFEPWMNWNNYGKYIVKDWNDNDSSTWKWSLDHIIPKRYFNYLTYNDSDFKECWSLKNLRPYSAKRNSKEIF
jgi:hypothetical protein